MMNRGKENVTPQRSPSSDKVVRKPKDAPGPKCKLKAKTLEYFLCELDARKERWMRDKERELGVIMKEWHQRLNNVVQMKDKEIKSLQHQMLRMSHRINTPHSSMTNSRATLLAESRDSVMMSKNQDVKNSSTVRKLRENICEMEKANCEKDIEIRRLQRNCDQDVQRHLVSAKRHINSLLEDIRKKDKQVVTLEAELKTMSHQISIASDSSRLVHRIKIAQIPRDDEYQKENQLLESKLAEALVRVKKLEVDNAELQRVNIGLNERLLNQQKQEATRQIAENTLAGNEVDNRLMFARQNVKWNRKKKYDLDDDRGSPCSLEPILEDSEEMSPFDEEPISDDEYHIVSKVPEVRPTSHSQTSPQAQIQMHPSHLQMQQHKSNNEQWLCEKLKLLSLVENLKENLHKLEQNRESYEMELKEVKEENDLLEFKLLEHQQSNAKSAVCDKLVGTCDDDEGFFSAMDSSDEENSYKNTKDEDCSENVRLKFILLKHANGLSIDQQRLIVRVKNIWESLEHQHAQCKSREMALMMQLRENEANWTKRFDEFRANSENVVRIICNSNEDSSSESEQDKEIGRLRGTISRLKKDSANCQQRNYELDCELLKREHQLKESLDEVDRLRKINSEYAESVNGYRKIEEQMSRRLAEAEFKCADVKEKFRESLNVIRQYEHRQAENEERIRKMKCELENKCKNIEELQMMQKRCSELERKVEDLSDELTLKTELLTSKNDVKHYFDNQQSCSKSEHLDVQTRSDDQEGLKLQKQMWQLKNYSWHLECQFDVQIKTVQMLKEQLQVMQNEESRKEGVLSQMVKILSDCSPEEMVDRLVAVAEKSKKSLVSDLCRKMADLLRVSTVSHELSGTESELWDQHSPVLRRAKYSRTHSKDTVPAAGHSLSVGDIADEEYEDCTVV